MTRLELITKRLAPIALGVAIAVMARDSCQHGTRIHTTFVLDPQEAAEQVDAIDATVVVDGATVGELHRKRVERAFGRAQFAADLPGEDGEVRVDATMHGDHRTIVRHFHASDGGTISLALGVDLR